MKIRLKPKVWTENKWKKKNGEIFSFVSFTSWDKKNKLWYRNSVEESISDRRNL